MTRLSAVVGVLLLAAAGAAAGGKSRMSEVTGVMKAYSKMTETWMKSSFGDALQLPEALGQAALGKLLSWGRQKPPQLKRAKQRRPQQQQPADQCSSPEAGERQVAPSAPLPHPGSAPVQKRTTGRKATVLQDDEEERASMTDDERRAYEAQRRREGRSQQLTPCSGGLQVYPLAAVNCGGNTGLTVQAWRALPESQRSQCTLDTTTHMSGVCVCPPDSVPVTERNLTYCSSIAPECRIAITEPSPAECPPLVYNLDWLEPCHWFSTSDTVTVTVNATCTLAPRNNITDQFPDYDIDQPLPAQREGSSLLDYKSIRQVYETSFASVALGINLPLTLSSSHWLAQHSLAVKLYNFNRLGDNAWRFDWSVQDMNPGELTGEVLLSRTIDLAQVPARYFHGGRMYLEAGFLFSPNHVAKLLLDFKDYDPEALQSTSSAMGAVIALSVVIGIVLCATGVIWYLDRAAKRIYETKGEQSF